WLLAGRATRDSPPRRWWLALDFPCGAIVWAPLTSASQRVTRRKSYPRAEEKEPAPPPRPSAQQQEDDDGCQRDPNPRRVRRRAGPPAAHLVPHVQLLQPVGPLPVADGLADLSLAPVQDAQVVVGNVVVRIVPQRLQIGGHRVVQPPGLQVQ